MVELFALAQLRFNEVLLVEENVVERHASGATVFFLGNPHACESKDNTRKRREKQLNWYCVAHALYEVIAILEILIYDHCTSYPVLLSCRAFV